MIADRGSRAWRSGPEWFSEHFDDAAGQVVDFLGADGLDYSGRDVADVGCGEGVIDLGFFHRAHPRSLVGFDLFEVDRGHLERLAATHRDITRLPDGLTFKKCGPSTLPAEDDTFDLVFSWSAFEHILDPVAVTREIRRVLRPNGVLMIQLWPFFHSEHGSHLWEWSPEGFVQLLDGRQAAVEQEVADDLAAEPDWAQARIEESRTLNRINLDDLHRALLAGGFYISKLEVMTNPFHVPRELARHSLSSLAIGGAKLVANPL